MYKRQRRAGGLRLLGDGVRLEILDAVHESRRRNRRFGQMGRPIRRSRREDDVATLFPYEHLFHVELILGRAAGLTAIVREDLRFAFSGSGFLPLSLWHIHQYVLKAAQQANVGRGGQRERDITAGDNTAAVTLYSI